MAENNGQVLESEQQTDAKDVQVLDGEKQTNPQTGEDEIDITKNLGKKFIINPKRPDLTLTGEELRNAVGLSKMVSQKESELHKTKSELDQIKAELEQTKKDNELLKLIRESRSSVQEDESEDVFNFDETPPVDTKKVVRQTIEPELDQFKKELKSEIQEIKEREKQREERLAYQKFGEQTRNAEKILLQKEFPSLSNAEIEEMVGNVDAIDNLTTEAVNASLMGDHDTAMEKKIEARDRQAYLTELKLKATAKQQRDNEKRKAKEQLETKSTADVVMPDILSRPAKNPKEAKAKEEAMDKFLAERRRSRQILRNVTG